MSVLSPPVIGPPVITVRGRDYPLVLPDIRDPRVHLAAVIISLQVLGQTVLGFELSVAQILVSVATCAALEVVVTFRRHGILMWPASALLTGNGVAFILRVPGTRHGDWWSLRGAGLFAGVAAVSMLSKYLIRVGGRHLFNPSNIGLVACFVLLGTRRANPQDLWWGHLSPAVAVTYAVILIGGLSIVTRLRMLGLAAAFWLSFAAATGLTAAGGHCMTARWHIGPVCGSSYWWVLVTSPEILVFLFFMITDPKTTPERPSARLGFGVAVGLLAALLAAPARTEFATKVGVLGGLALVCALRPLVAAVVARAARRRAVTRGKGWPDQRLLGGAIGICGAGAFAVGLLWAGSAARSAASPVASPGHTPAAARPEVAIDPAAVPAVTISPAVRSVDGNLGPSVTRQMALDLEADLEIEADALSRKDPALAAAASTGSALQALQVRMASPATAPGSGPAPRSVAHLTAVLVPDQANPQGSPRVGLEAQGANLDRTYVLTLVGGHYLISSDSSTSHAGGRS